MKRFKPQSRYGIDAPPIVLIFFGIGSALLVLVWLQPKSILTGFLALQGITLCAMSCLFVAYGLFGKYIYRTKMLRMIPWRGDEVVLDIGTGRGFLMNGAAQQLTTGSAIGVDIWNDRDLSGNTFHNCRKNIELEGLTDKAQCLTMDARKLAFASNSFDVILSNLCIHNISDRQGQIEACREITRVLKPGGVALISDFTGTRLYNAVFKQAGLKTGFSRRYWFSILAPLPLRMVRVDYPSESKNSAAP